MLTVIIILGMLYIPLNKDGQAAVKPATQTVALPEVVTTINKQTPTMVVNGGIEFALENEVRPNGFNLL